MPLLSLATFRGGVERDALPVAVGGHAGEAASTAEDDRHLPPQLVVEAASDAVQEADDRRPYQTPPAGEEEEST